MREDVHERLNPLVEGVSASLCGGQISVRPRSGLGEERFGIFTGQVAPAAGRGTGHHPRPASGGGHHAQPERTRKTLAERTFNLRSLQPGGEFNEEGIRSR